MRHLLEKLCHLIFPSRPDPAKSRRIAEIRLVLCGFISIVILIVIGARIIELAEESDDISLAAHTNIKSQARGRILDRQGRLLATNLPITVLHANPTEIMNIDDAAIKLSSVLTHHTIDNLRSLLSKKSKYIELDQLYPRNMLQFWNLYPWCIFRKRHYESLSERYNSRTYSRFCRPRP